MKKQILLSLLMLFISSLSFSQRLTQTEALEYVKEHFANQDVDYYGIDSNSQTYWQFFVDAEPMKGWAHECYRIFVYKNLTVDDPVAIMEKLSMPPDGIIPFPLEVKNRYEKTAIIKPYVKNLFQANSPIQPSEAALRTHALIISGGINYFSNHERYWNDCSFIYQTLVNRYGVPKENIFPIMSDGDSPFFDMILADRSDIVSQPLDLDFDGVDDIKMSASRENIKNVLTSLESKLEEDDQLFIYVIDHGDTDDKISKSYICLWGNERLYDYELAAWLKPFSDKYVNINVVLGQCFSGGFIDDLREINCVVATASDATESSWACTDIPYDEFVYQWTCAVNGSNHLGQSVNVAAYDSNNVTMEEAFNYAKSHDRRFNEHPMYSSTPLSIGEDLSFNYLAPAVDLYIRDNIEDTGKEPNRTTDQFWLSPDLWVRNYDDGIYEPENPFYAPDHQAATIYTRIYNRGKKDFDGSGKWLFNYWAKASTCFSAKAWKGLELFEGEPTGGYGRARPISAIKSGECVIVNHPWELPIGLVEGSTEDYTDKHHFCLLAKIMDQHYEDGYQEGINYFDVPGKKTQVQINVSVISKEDLTRGTSIYLRNNLASEEDFSLELRPREQSDLQLFNLANVEMELSPTIISAWELGGKKLNSMTYNPTIAPSVMQFTSAESQIRNIRMDSDAFDKVTLRILFRDENFTPGKTYTYDLIQRNSDGKIVGGETFIIESPELAMNSLTIKSIVNDDGSIKSVAETDSNIVNWFDASTGEHIGAGNTLQQNVGKDARTFIATAMSAEGKISFGNISVEAPFAILSVDHIANSGELKINLSDMLHYDCDVLLTSFTTGGEVGASVAKAGAKSVEMSGLRLNAGVYVVTLMRSGEIVASYKFSL